MSKLIAALKLHQKLSNFCYFLLLFMAIIMPGKILAENQQYVPHIPDLPVPANFFLEQNNESAFISEVGRIIEVTYLGQSSLAAVQDYYRLTLPELGWEPINHLRLTFLLVPENIQN